VLEIAKRELLQMRKNFFAQIGFRFARKTIDIDAPAIAKKALEDRAHQDQQRKINQRDAGQFLLHRRIDAFLDQPWQRDPRDIRTDQ
jgi:hypothetical protein